MDAPLEQRVFRHHDRRECALPARLGVASTFEERVVLSRAACDVDRRVAGRVVDCSAGGVGLQTTAFFPRRCEIDRAVEVPAPGGGVGTVRVCVRVQRVTMMSREPRYYIGASFSKDDPEARDAVSRLLRATDTVAGEGVSRG